MIDDAHRDGYWAYHDGLSRDDNPYDNNSEWDLNQAWLDGFMEAVWELDGFMEAAWDD